MAQPKVMQVWWSMRATFGAFFLLAGADKFTYIVTDWEKYLSPFIKAHVPMEVSTFLMCVGIFEVLLGVLYLTQWTKEAAYIGSAWLMIIIVNLLSCGTYVDIALRDAVAASGSFALARLSEALRA